MSKEKFYITTAIAYTSKKPHIGNTYEIVLTDAIARFNRFIGKDVFFLTGTDEHGQKIQEIAENEGITPKQHVDKIAGQIKDIADMLNISYDKFILTKGITASLAKASGQTASLWTANARTAAAPCTRPRKKPISSK